MAGALTEPTPRQTPPGGDRRVKIALLIASGVTFAFLVAAMARENFLSPWRYHQRQYREMLANSPDERQRKLAESFNIEIRQVDLPQLASVRLVGSRG